MIYTRSTTKSIQICINAPSSPTSAQLGTYPCEILSVTPVGELPSDTLILVDTSGSIPADIRQKTKDLIMELIDQKQENERYSIASFGTEINVLCDYTSDRYDLAKALEGLDYSEKYTYVYSVLDKVLDNDRDDFYRIVMISDGVENSRDGITYDEILNKISSGHCPVYTVGIENGNQESLKSCIHFQEILMPKVLHLQMNRIYHRYAIRSIHQEILFVWKYRCQMRLQTEV